MKKVLLLMSVFLTLTLCACKNGNPENAVGGYMYQNETKNTECTAEELFGIDFTKTENVKMKINYCDVTDKADVDKVMQLMSGLYLKKVEMLPLEGGVPTSITVGDKTVELVFGGHKPFGDVIGFGGDWYDISPEIMDEISEMSRRYQP